MTKLGLPRTCDFYAFVLAVGAQLSAAGCAKKTRPQGDIGDGRRSRAEADRVALESASVGTWHAPWGRLTFKTDGTASFSLRTHCVEGIESSAPVRLNDDCPAAETSGRLSVEPYRFALHSGDGSHLFDAFLDADGRIHVDVLLEERITPVDAQRRGSIELGMFKSISVGSDCSLLDEFSEPSPIPCRFEKEGSLTLFQFRVPSGTNVHDQNVDRTMIYLERENLLVPPSIHRLAFERSGD